jgi:dihydroneopterin aldolase
MPDHLIIERLEFQGHCGVSLEERQIPQPIAVDAELDYPLSALSAAAGSGDLAQAVDYARVAERVVEIGQSQHFHLIETLADRILAMIVAEFPVARVRLWVRKIAPPLKHVRGSVGVRLDRARTEDLDRLPARFLIEQLSRLPKGLALDVAAGSGRNALYLASHGFTVDAIDRDERALAQLSETARPRSLSNVTVRTLDLEADPEHPPAFPKDRYDVILVFFYLHRPLFPALLDALKLGGMLVYETFLIDNHVRRQHPRRKEFCLAHNELLHLTPGLRILHYDEGEHADCREGMERAAHDSAVTARLLAQRIR